MSGAAPTARSPLDGLTLPGGEKFTLVEAPAAARFILRGGEAARAACAAAFGAELPSRLGRAGEVGGRRPPWVGAARLPLVAGLRQRGARSRGTPARAAGDH